MGEIGTGIRSRPEVLRQKSFRIYLLRTANVALAKERTRPFTPRQPLD